MLTKLLYLLVLIVLSLGVFQLFYNGRVSLGPTGLCFDLTNIFYQCR